jgi:hypothetical protein
MSVKCGNHGKGSQVHHESIAAVRACFQNRYTASAPKPASAPQRPAAPKTPKPAPRRQADLLVRPGEIAVTGTLHEGYFTVVFEGGERRTLRVRRQAKNSAFKPGQLLVSYLDGSDNENDYQSVGEAREFDGKAVAVRIWYKHRSKEMIVEAVKVLCGDPQAAASAYAEESDNCSACNHVLTVPVEENPYRKYGLGPKCGPKHLGEL